MSGWVGEWVICIAACEALVISRVYVRGIALSMKDWMEQCAAMMGRRVVALMRRMGVALE